MYLFIGDEAGLFWLFIKSMYVRSCPSFLVFTICSYLFALIMSVGVFRSQCFAICVGTFGRHTINLFLKCLVLIPCRQSIMRRKLGGARMCPWTVRSCPPRGVLKINCDGVFCSRNVSVVVVYCP